MKTNTTTDQDLLRMHEEYTQRFELAKNDLKSKKAAKSREATAELTDSYVKKLLKQQKYPKEMIENADVLEVKRLIIKTNRLCKSK